VSVEIKKVLVSADWTIRKDGSLGVPTKYITYWRVLLDGKCVDSFLGKGQAEKKAAVLRHEQQGATA
jgi:hypothetical protein